MSLEESANFEKTLTLGKELAETLSKTDLTGRWMAHQVGDLIVKAEVAGAADVAQARRDAEDLILKLWRHRATLAGSNRPMSSFEPVFAALDRLSEPQSPWQFYGHFDPGDEPDEADLIGIRLLQIALRLEDTMRDVVRDIVLLAIEEAAETEARWIKLSEGMPEDPQSQAIQAVLELSHTIRSTTEGATMEVDPSLETDAATEKLISTLRKASALMEGVCAALEERTPR